MRGLKQYILQTDSLVFVAPYVGAWIETMITTIIKQWVRVAPYVGAWIETEMRKIADEAEQVAPYVGAWIETSYRLTLLQLR